MCERSRFNQQRRLVLTFLVGLVMLLTPISGWTQDVVRPNVGTATITRLPAPKPTARQLPDGRIEVSWPAVEGAIGYDLRRSVPPTPQTAISRPNPSETVYIDTDVKAGSTYYYVVGAVDSSGIVGLRGGTPPVTATVAPGGSTTTTTTTTTPASTTPPTAAARLSDPPANRLIEVTWSAVPGATKYSLELVLYGWMPSDPTQMDPSNRTSLRRIDWPASESRFAEPVLQYEYPAWFRYEVTPQLASGPGTRILSNIVAMPPKGKPVDIGRAASVRVGGTTSFVQNYVGCRWVSLDEQIAVVNSSGIVTGVRPGLVQILCVKSAYVNPMYSAFVAAIPLTVAP